MKGTELERRILGSTGIEVSSICYGCAGAWGRELISDEKATELFRAALSLGINFFDTGHSYNKSEERIGKALSSLSTSEKKNIVISTKFGTRIKDGKRVHDTSRDWVLKSVETSLERMKIDRIDLLYVHGPQIYDFNDSFFRTLEELKSQGIVKAVGANTFDTGVLEYIAKEKCLDVVMLDYNIVRQDREPIIKKFYDEGIGVVAGQALAEGLFSKELFRIRGLKDLWYIARTFGRKPSRELWQKSKNYRFLNNVCNIKGSELALKYVLDNPYVASASVGTCSPEHLRSNINAASVSIPPEIYDKIKKAGKS